MKFTTVLFCFFITLFMSSYLFGAEENSIYPAERGVYFGIGTNINATNFYLPIQIGANLRLEPSIGISMTNNTYTVDSSSLFYKSNTLTYRFGIGGLYTFKPMKSTFIYTGVRLSYGLTKSDVYTHHFYSVYSNGKLINTYFDTTSNTNKQNYILASGVFGGEYFLFKQISLGVEAQLNYTRYLTPDTYVNNNKVGISEENYYVINNACLLFVRYYFNY